MACYFNTNGDLIMRRGDTAVFTISSADIPFENYDTAYFAIINRETLEPVLPELYEPTDTTRSVTFTFTVEQTESLPQPAKVYNTYGYVFKLCTAEVEDTFIPQVVKDTATNTLVMKNIPRVLFYPKVIEGSI